MISFKAKSKGLSYEVDIDNTLPDGLKGDELRIRQVITNLLKLLQQGLERIQQLSQKRLKTIYLKV
jgi:signal transduction histidine kinase